LKQGLVQAVVALDRGREVMRSMPLIRASGMGETIDPAKLRDETVDLGALAEAGRV
jgi:hypothetical protein